MTPAQLAEYYANLLILQYISGEKNYQSIITSVTPILLPQTTVQMLTFSGVAASGTFILNYGAYSTATIQWNDSTNTIQSKLQALTGLGSILVTGTIASEVLTVTFNGVPPIALPLIPSADTLETAGSVAITITVAQIDVTLPLAVQNAYNLIGPDTAQGVQLDVLGKYAGVVRTVNTPQGPVSLNDAEFLTLIRLAIIKNSSGSSLAAIQNLIHIFFPGQILVFDYQDMEMSFLISSAIGDLNFLYAVLTEGLLPVPMAVGFGIIIFAPVINSFFGFRTYELPSSNNKPFNTYSDYNTTWPWLSYQDSIVI